MTSCPSQNESAANICLAVVRRLATASCPQRATQPNSGDFSFVERVRTAAQTISGSNTFYTLSVADKQEASALAAQTATQLHRMSEVLLRANSTSAAACALNLP